MKKLPQVRKDINSNALNTSSQALQYGRTNIMGSLETMAEEDTNQRVYNYTQMSKQSLSLVEMNQQIYSPARYPKAVEYKQSRSYLKKNGDEYNELDLFCDTQELKYFGLGVYFYIELFRRLTWVLLFMAVVQCITIIINFKGDGLSSYESSFSTYLIKSTLGNFSGSNGTTLTSIDNFLIAILPAVNFLALFIFTLIWKLHVRRAINKQEEDNNDVKPQKFCIEFEGFDANEANQEDLRKFFSNYGPVYESSFVRNHQNKLSCFQELDKKEEQIKTLQLEAIFGSGSPEQIEVLKTQKAEILDKIQELNIRPATISAYVHFQFQKTKLECLEEFKDKHFYSSCGHSCFRNCCCCCLSKDLDKVTYKNAQLLVKDSKVPAPEDINWNYFQISTCNRFLRGVIAFLVIILFLAISCSIIGLCSIYISSHSNNCDGLGIASYTASTATATGNTIVIQCYCNAHFIDSFSDNSVKTACADYINGIAIEQSIQYVVIITASIMNFLFGFIVDKLINCVRPISQDAALSTKTAIYTVFLVINSIIVPILIYADIFGFQASKYVSFVTMISTDINSFFNVSSISFYPGFSAVWYRNVSPIFTNFLIFNTVMVWLFFVIDKCFFANNSSLQKKEGTILQKHMNREIISYKLDIYKETANLYLVLIIVLVFFTGVPVFLPIGFVNILSRYIVNRSLLQKNSVRIQGLGHEFSRLSVTILFIAVIAFPLIGEWMLIGNSKILSDAKILFGTFSLSISSGFYQFEEELYLPWYIGISVLAMVELIIYETVIRFCTCLCSCCATPIPKYHSRPFGEYAKGMNILCSYSIRKNDSMKNAIIVMQKYLSDKTAA